MNSADQPFVVMKFGGTSVAEPDRWQRIARLVDERLEEGLHPVLTCSALGGVSDALEGILEKTQTGGDWETDLAALVERHRMLADDLGVELEGPARELADDLRRRLKGATLVEEVTPRLRARVMATGELLASRIGAAFLGRDERAVDWVDARNWLTSTPTQGDRAERDYLSARCEVADDPDFRDRLAGAPVHVTQGFIARNPDDETVLLGRGGSDTSAAYFAAKLGAERVEIWTDVHGMFTADPTRVPSARLLKQLDYDEARELATMGADVLHPRSVDPVASASIPLEIHCIDAPDAPGTRVGEETADAGPRVKAISAKTGIPLVSMETLGMWQEVGFLADAFDCFRRNGLSVDLVATSETNVTVSLDPTANALDDATLDQLLDDLDAHCDASAIGPCAVVSLVGRHIRSLLHELGPALEVFDEENVYLVTQAASDLNFSFVVDEHQRERLVRELHALLFDDRDEDALLGPTWEELTGEVDREPTPEPSVWWRRRREELVSLADEHAPTYVYDLETVDSAVDSLEAIDAVDRRFYAMKANANREVLKRIESRGLGFECVSPGELERLEELFPDLDPSRVLFTPNFAARDEYAAALDRGVHVTVDGLHPLREWPDLFEDREIFLRVDPGSGRGHHEFVRTAGARSKFGIAPDGLAEAADRVDAVGAEVVGLHAHLGSGITSPETWAETGKYLADVADRFDGVRYLDVGGGLGVGDRLDGSPLNLDEVDRHLRSLANAHPEFEIWMEPGRFLVADAGVLLARVTQLKRKGALVYVGLETGMNSLLRPALYGAYHHIENLSRPDAPAALRAEIVGPICESGDVLGHGRRLPTTSEGDVLAVAQTGAYGHAMSSRYNLRPPADEIALD